MAATPRASSVQEIRSLAGRDQLSPGCGREPTSNATQRGKKRAFLNALAAYRACAKISDGSWIRHRICSPLRGSSFREHPVAGKGLRRTVDADLPKQTPPQV